MILKSAALGVAMAETDWSVREEGGNNEGKRVRQYLNGAGINVAAPWCAAFVDYCVDLAAGMLRATNPLEGVKHQALVQSYADTLGHAVVGPQDAEPGDLCLFSFGGERWDHIGFVLEAPNSEGFFRSIEGNTSDESQRDGDAVAVKRRTLGTGTREPMFIRWSDDT